MKRTLLISAICIMLVLAGCSTDVMTEVQPTLQPTPTQEAKSVEIESVQTPTPTPVPTPTPTPSPSPTPSGLLGGRFADKFIESAEELTEDGYKSKNISFTVKTVRDEDTYSNLVTYFVVDIYVQDVKSIKTAAAKGKFDSRNIDKVKNIAVENNALVAISGDYYSDDDKSTVLRNGVMYRDKINNRKDICVLYMDGTMETYLAGEFELDAIVEREPWQIWSFGPALLDADGKSTTEFNSSLRDMNPRCTIGYYEPGHYCFVMVDGRKSGYSYGLRLTDLSLLMSDLGCVRAYNLDGGASAQLYWQDDIFNVPSGYGRSMSDIIYISSEQTP